MKKVLAIAAISGLALAATSANAAYFSFASDNLSSESTFKGGGSSMGSGLLNGKVDLLIDDNNGVLPTITFNGTTFSAGFSDITLRGSSTFAGVTTLVYSLSGEFSFTNGGQNLLSVSFVDAVMSVQSKNNKWMTTGSVLGSDQFTTVTATTDLNMAAYDLAAGTLKDVDFAFGLTALKTVGGSAGVAIDEISKLPTARWEAEASYNGTASMIPAPGSLALAGLGGLMCARRRRNAK